MKIYGLSEQNQQPEPPARKPNEDSFFVEFDSPSNKLIAVVMDGIPVLRDAYGNYPEENGSIASQIAVNEIGNFLKSRRTPPNSEDFLAAFRLANYRIRIENEIRKTYAKKELYWLATVGCALWADTKTSDLFFGFIGDPLAFSISRKGEILLLTEDQLKPFEDHLYAVHSHEFKDPGVTASIREHQDRYVRNVWNTECFCGQPLRGWGALTGQDEAVRFLVARKIKISDRLRFVLASDAIEAIGAGNAKERRAEDYKDALLSTLSLGPKETTQKLLELTRAGEKEKKCKSDDATFVVVDF